MYELKTEIVNNDGLPMKFVIDEIQDLKDTTGRQVKRIEFIDLGNGNCKEVIDWWPVSFERTRRIIR